MLLQQLLTVNRLLIWLQKFAEIWCSARDLCPALVAAWVGGSLAVKHPPPHGGGTFLCPWVFPNFGWVGPGGAAGPGPCMRPPPVPPPPPSFDR